jgi:hypothetical protein
MGSGQTHYAPDATVSQRGLQTAPNPIMLPTQRATRDPAIDRSVETITSKPQNRAARRRRELDPDRDTGRLLQASEARRSLILGDTLVEDRDNALSEDEGSVLSPPFYRRR